MRGHVRSCFSDVSLFVLNDSEALLRNRFDQFKPIS